MENEIKNINSQEEEITDEEMFEEIVSHLEGGETEKEEFKQEWAKASEEEKKKSYQDHMERKDGMAA